MMQSTTKTDNDLLIFSCQSQNRGKVGAFMYFIREKNHIVHV